MNVVHLLVYIATAVLTMAGVAVFLKVRDRWWRWLGFAGFGIGLLLLLYLPVIWRRF